MNGVEINKRAYVATRLLLRWDYLYAVTLKTKVFGDYNHARLEVSWITSTRGLLLRGYTGRLKIRASQSRDSACGNGSKGLVGLRYDLRCEGELKSSCTCACFSHHLVLPRYQAFFPSFCLFPGGTPPIVHSPNVDASGLFADLLSSNPVPEGLPNRGQRQERPRLAGAHNSACRQSTRKVLSANWLLPVSTAREIERA